MLLMDITSCRIVSVVVSHQGQYWDGEGGIDDYMRTSGIVISPVNPERNRRIPITLSMECTSILFNDYNILASPGSITFQLLMRITVMILIAQWPARSGSCTSPSDCRSPSSN